MQASSKLGLISKVYSATVLAVNRGQCGQATNVPVKVYCTNVKFRLTEGPDRGHDRTISFSASPSTPHLARGDKVVLSHIDHADPGFDYTYSDRQRRPVLLWLFVLFGVGDRAGRWRGLAALAGLGASMVVIVVFLLPSILDGNNAELVAIVGATAVAYLALYLANVPSHDHGCAAGHPVGAHPHCGPRDGVHESGPSRAPATKRRSW